MKQNLLFNQASALGKRLAMVLTMLLTIGIGQAWGADYSKNESWAFTTSGNSNWSGHNSGYCGACGNKSSSFNVYKTNITNFSNIDFSKYENVSLTIYVKAGTNNGTNSYTVKLINASGNQVSTYTSTKTNGMGTGSSSSYAKESSVTFNPTMAFSGYKIEFPAKAYITQTRYVLTYDDKTVSYTINWTINPTAGGSLSATSGNSTTVSPNAAYTYGTPAYTVTSGEATVSQSGNTFTATPTEDCSIQINMEEKPKYTVNWYVNGSKKHSQTDVSGTALTGIPVPTTLDCDGEREFVGWTTLSSYEHATNAPTDLITNTSGLTMPENGANYYAVFAEASGDGEITTTKTETFENQTSYSSESNWKQALTWSASESKIGVEWTTYYGKILASDDYVELRTYSDGVMGYIWTSQKLKGIKSIQFNGWCVNSTDKADMVVSYSTDNETWNELGTHIAGTTSTSQSIIYTLPDYGVDKEYYISIDLQNATCPNSSNKKYRIDNIAFTFVEGSGTTYSDYTTSCSTETLPSMTASVSSLAFGNVTVNQSSQKTFTLSGSNLTADATLALSGTNANMFSVTPTSVTQSSGSITNETITVTYTPTTKASHSATLTISSTDAESIEISLSGTGVAQTANYTVKHYQQNLDDTYPAEPTYTETLSGEVGTIVTPDFKSYEGFTDPTEKKSVEITADGNAIVEYQYARNSYTLTWDLDGGTITTAGTPEGAVKYGASLTAPVVEKDGFNFKGWDPKVPDTMPADNATYTAQWKATYTVTFLNHGEEVEKVTVEAGNSVTLPTEELTSCDTEKYPHFYGWTANPIDGVGTTEPADLITANFTPNNSVTLHAVFVDRLPQAGGWQMVTSTSELVVGKIYTIGSYGSPDSGVAMGTQNSTNRGTANWTTGTPVELTLGGSTGAWTLYDPVEEGYLYAASNSSNHLKTQSTLNDNGKWAITFNSEEANIVAQGSNSHKYMRYNPNNGSPIFSCYEKSSSQSDIFLLTKSMATQPSAYITSCCETPAPTNGTYTNVTGSGSSMSVKLTWEDAANAGSYHITGENLADDVYATNYTVSGLTECETYTFYVSAFPVGGCESPKLAIEVTPYIPKTVTFVDGSTTTQKTTSCGSETVTVPNASKECYTSIWTDENGNEYSNDQTITPTEDMILTAQYTIIEYEITFKNYDGTVLQTSTIACGTKPTYGGETPTREQDEMYEYEFAGWTPSIKEADDHQTYTATYTQTQHQITVIWMVNGEEYTEGEPSNMVLAGEKVAKLPTPPSPDDYCGQVFAGWTDQPIDGAPIPDAPAVLFNTHEASPTLYKEGDKTTVTFYAVFADIKE